MILPKKLACFVAKDLFNIWFDSMKIKESASLFPEWEKDEEEQREQQWSMCKTSAVRLQEHLKNIWRDMTKKPPLKQDIFTSAPLFIFFLGENGAHKVRAWQIQ